MRLKNNSGFHLALHSAQLRKWSCIFAVALVVLATVGCFRTSGYGRPTLTAYEIPAIGGIRVTGLKSMAGAGDYYLGNDYIALTVDGTPPSESYGIAGAPGGGSIVDVGAISLDTSFRQVSLPSDMLDRMTTVINQDPDITVIFNEFRAFAEPELAWLELQGYVHDPKNKLLGATWDSKGIVQDVSASAVISLGRMDRMFSLKTTVTNNSASPINIRNIGDFVYQRGGGFRYLAIVNEDYSGVPLSSWGVDMPGADFSNPLLSSVRSNIVALMGTEPGSNTLDSHATLGLMPLDSEQFLVASDPQESLSETRPVFPERFVAGSLDTGRPLEQKESLTHRRYLFVKGGESGQMEYIVIPETTETPNQATGLLNYMFREMANVGGKKFGLLVFSVEGTGTRSGSISSELRFERYMGDGDPKADQIQAHWRLERLEWMEPPETYEQLLAYDNYSAVAETPLRTFGVLLPEGTYRIVSRSRLHSTTLVAGTNVANADRPSLATPITLDTNLIFSLGETLSPERSESYTPSGYVQTYAEFTHTVATRGNDTDPDNDSDTVAGFVQPLRLVIKGLNDLPDPTNRRRRSITSIFDPNTRAPRTPGYPRQPLELAPGPFQFSGGNSAFGVQMIDGYANLPLYTPLGQYQIYGARGPLSILESFTVNSRPNFATQNISLTIFQARPPEGWIGFDTPGPSQATSGGMLPCEQLASALAEDIRVIARTELDHQTDGASLHKEFHASLNYLYQFKTAIGGDPEDTMLGDPLIVNARSADLDSHGFVTALFTPVQPGARNGGARPSRGWTLADFLKQAEGGYNVIHRPRGPQGLFTQLGFNPRLPLAQGAPWWYDRGSLSLSRTNGEFDALEILNAGSIASSGIDVWWSEYRSVREDWFALLNQQTPDFFTKALGFSSGRFSEDTPVGLTRTWLYVGDAKLRMDNLDPVLYALKTGAAVASTGPMLDVKVSGVGPGGMTNITGTPSSVTLDITLVTTDWMPVDELRVIINGNLVATVSDPKTTFIRSATDSRFFTGTVTVPVPTGKDAWLVVEAGAPLGTTGVYKPEWRAWNALMKGIYPIAITNPIFLNLTTGAYVPPGI